MRQGQCTTKLHTGNYPGVYQLHAQLPGVHHFFISSVNRHHNDRNHHGNKTGHHTNMASSPPH